MKSLLQCDYRCSCGKLLFKGLILKDHIDSKCPRCSKLATFKGVGVFENPRRLVVLTDRAGKIINISLSVESLLGFSVDSLIGQSFASLLASELDVNADAIIAKKTLAIDYLRIDLQVKIRDDSVELCSVRYRSIILSGESYILRIIDFPPIINPEIISGVSFNHDNLGDFETESNSDNVLLYISRSAEKIFGFRPEEVIGESVENYKLPEELEWREKNMKWLVLLRKSFRSLDFKTLDKQGRVVVYDLYCVPLYNDHGDFVGFRSVCWLK